MAWSAGFKRMLENDTLDAYTPMFRLQIGSCMIVGNHVGAWEKDRGMKALEISTHPGCTSAATYGTSDDTRTFFRSSTDLGYGYLYSVGMTSEIQLGAQSVDPRTFMYTPMNLRVGVTQFAASLAQQMTIGTMACLQIYIPSYDKSVESDWENIFLGSFKGMEWNGEKYTLKFDDAIALAKHNSTARSDYAGWAIDGYSSWFGGCGTTSVSTIEGTVTDFTDGDLKIAQFYAERVTKRHLWGFTYKKVSGGFSGAFAPAHTHYLESDTGALNMWATISSTDRTEYIHYEGHTDLGGKIVLTDTNSYIGFAAYMPGHFGHGAHTVIGAGATGSGVRSKCVVTGTPVSEFVNTVYVQGYHPFMVPGIFATGYGESYRPDILNWYDINVSQKDFIEGWSMLTGTDSHDVAPFKANMTEVVDGLSVMNKRVGKWGVNPRFKQGGYGIAAHPARRLGGGFSSTNVEYYAERSERNARITGNDIEGAELQMVHPQMRGSFKKVRYTSNAPDNGDDGAEKDVRTSVPPTGSMRDAPLLYELKVNTSDCAEGYADETALRYAKYAEGLHTLVYCRSHLSAKLRLRGLKHAGLAPGDWVDVSIARDNSFPYNADWGPVNSHPGSQAATLNTWVEYWSADGDVESRRITVPWFVTSVHVDWVRCLVTVQLSRHNPADEEATGSMWISGPVDSAAERAESQDMGMPIFKKSGK